MIGAGIQQPHCSQGPLVGGIDYQSALKLFPGLGVLPLLRQNETQIHIRPSIARVILNGLLEQRNGRPRFPLLSLEDAQIVLCFGIGGINHNRGLELVF